MRPITRFNAWRIAAMLAGTVGRMAWGALADALGDARKVLIALGAVTAVCVALLTQVNAQWPYAGVVGLAIVLGACTLGWNGVYVAELARTAPEERVAQATGASLMFAYSGAVLVPPLFALLHALSASYVLPFTMLALLAGAGAVSLARRT